VLSNSEVSKAHWCIVIDEHGPGWSVGSAADRSPVQYCRLGGETTPLQRALHRAASFAPASQIMLTALEEYRDMWEPSAWRVRPYRRFIGDNRWASQLCSAAAILSVASRSPSSVITILPARCYVVDEWILARGIRHALSELPGVPEGVVTLGMLDMEDGVDENYLIVSQPRFGRGLSADGFARRPVAWVARHLKSQGALVASSIMIGYAGVFAAHISKHWPGISNTLAQLSETAEIAGEECDVPSSLNREAAKSTLRALRWHPPTFRQRVIGVCRCGWSGLNSPQSVARIYDFLASESKQGHGFLQNYSNHCRSTKAFPLSRPEHWSLNKGDV
jgi:mannose-1-phosphate guanylyltransferase